MILFVFKTGVNSSQPKLLTQIISDCQLLFSHLEQSVCFENACGGILLVTGYMYLLQPNCGVPASNTLSLENLDVLSCILVAPGVTSPVGVVSCVMGGWSLRSL